MQPCTALKHIVQNTVCDRTDHSVCQASKIKKMHVKAIPSHHNWQYVTQSLKDFFRYIVFADWVFKGQIKFEVGKYYWISPERQIVGITVTWSSLHKKLSHHILVPSILKSRTFPFDFVFLAYTGMLTFVHSHLIFQLLCVFVAQGHTYAS